MGWPHFRGWSVWVLNTECPHFGCRELNREVPLYIPYIHVYSMEPLYKEHISTLETEDKCPLSEACLYFRVAFVRFHCFEIFVDESLGGSEDSMLEMDS